MKQVAITELREDVLHPLFHQYAKQCQPQRAFICLDTETRTLSADWYGEIGNGCFARTYLELDIEFSINPELTAREINELMSAIAPACEELLAGLECESPSRGCFEGLAQEVQRRCEITTESGGVWDAAQFFDGGQAPASREEALALAADYDGGVTLTGLDEFLQAKKEQAE